MANSAIEGQLINAGSRRPLTAVRVEAWEVEGRRDRPLGRASTDASGTFAIELDPRQYEKLVARNASVFFRVYRDDRLVLETAEAERWTPRGGRQPLVISVPGEESSGPDGQPELFKAEGRVTDPGGVAITDARVEVWDHNL